MLRVKMRVRIGIEFFFAPAMRGRGAASQSTRIRSFVVAA